MVTFFSKKNRVKINQLLIGNDNEFTAEHQILNGSIIFIGLIYLTTVILNYLSDLSFIVTVINSFVTLVFVVMYYFSRYQKVYKTVLFIFYLSIFSSLTADWFLASGLISSMPYYYLAFICFIIFFSSGTYRLVLVIIYILDIALLFIIEFNFPEVVTPYPNREVQLKDMYESFLLMVILIIYIVYSGKKLYLKERQNTIDLIKQYRINSEKLKNEFNNQIEKLSLREREVFQLIIEGKSNQDIAEKLFIEVGTVKIHINKIYKKLGTKDRKETINYVLRHK